MFVVAITGLALACGGGNGGGGEARSEAGLEQAARETFQAFIDNDGRGMYARFTDACRDEQSYDDFNANLVIARAFFQAFLDIEPDDLRIKDVEVRNLDGDRAEARIVIEASDDPDKDLGEFNEDFQPWVYEGGGWRTTDCDDESDDDGSIFDDPTEAPPADWARVVETDAQQTSGGVTLKATRVSVGAPDDVRSAVDWDDEWDDASAVMQLLMTVTNDTDTEVNLFTYGARVVVDGRQLDIDTFNSDTPTDLLPRASAEMTVYVAVPSLAPEDIESVRFAMDAPTNSESFDDLGPDFLLDIDLD